MGLRDFFLNVATGGAYGLTKATVEETADLVSSVARGPDRQSAASPAAPVATARAARANVCEPVVESGACGTTNVCCGGAPGYQMHGAFLLETASGRVWRYESTADAFVELRRLSTKLGERVASEVMADRVDEMKNEIQRELRQFPAEQKKAVGAQLMAQYVEPLEDEERERQQQLEIMEKLTEMKAASKQSTENLI